MRRAGAFAVAGANLGVVVIQIVTLAHEFSRSAPALEGAQTMFFLVANAAIAGWFIGHGQEVSR